MIGRWSSFWHDEKLKERIYIIIFQSDTSMGKAFDVFLLWAIVFSILLLMVESLPVLPPAVKSVMVVMEYFLTAFFTLEYLCRLYCSPKARDYALSFYGIVDLLSTLPLYLGWLFGPMRYLMIVRTFRLIRVFRVFKLFSFLAEGDQLICSLLMSARKIMVFFLFVVVMVITLGTMMYMVEGNAEHTAFTDIPTSIYWAVVTMTTVGYGDVAPVTYMGRFLSALVMLLGYTILAVPTGIVSAQFIHDHNHNQKKTTYKCPECGAPLQLGENYCSHCGTRTPFRTQTQLEEEKERITKSE